MAKLVYGVGFNSEKKPCKISGKMLREYTLWGNMLRRCYCEDYHINKPSYKDCHISDNFKDYSYFYKWCRDQVGFNNDEYQLDKDLLVKNNKIYSEDGCVFLPKEINMALNRNKRSRGLHPIGVSFDKKSNSFRARYSHSGSCLLIGYFDSADDAFNLYKTEKEKYLKGLAEKYRDHIDPRAYIALLEYKIEITD